MRTEMGLCWLDAYAVPNVLPSFPITVEAISVSIIKEDFLTLSMSSAEPMMGAKVNKRYGGFWEEGFKVNRIKDLLSKHRVMTMVLIGLFVLPAGFFIYRAMGQARRKQQSATSAAEPVTVR